MKNYQANPTDASLLKSYASYVKKYAEMADSFDKWEDEDLNDAETAYYLKVQTRINKKLIDASL